MLRALSLRPDPLLAAYAHTILRANDFLGIYTADGFIKTVAAGLKTSEPKHLQLKGLSGSIDAIILSAIFKIRPFDFLVILHDRDEAHYFQNDIQNLLGREILLFPMSYKRPYEFDETENANILMRAEVLNRLANKTSPEIIVTYPEALGEKVITKRSLASNTFTITLAVATAAIVLYGVPLATFRSAASCCVHTASTR